jgi:hypothetical protein
MTTKNEESRCPGMSDASVGKFVVDSMLAVAEPPGDVFGRPRYELGPGFAAVPFWSTDPSHHLTLVMATAVQPHHQRDSVTTGAQ